VRQTRIGRMVFSSVTFLFFFLPAVLIAYHAAPRRIRNGLLVMASLLFYTWGAGALVIPLVASIALNYVFGLGIERAIDGELRRRAQQVLGVAVVMNVGLLAWFKYANFGVASANGVIGSLGGQAIEWTHVLLPIGISFYTFHSLSYLIDIYRSTARHLVRPVDFSLYIAFFPQLIAGPIVRFHEIRDQLVSRRETTDLFAAGVYRFCHGLGKKVLIADTVAPVANVAFGIDPSHLSSGAAAIGLVAYAVQLYFDFSGYTDMALGMGAMFGIRLPENFDRPYAARSVTEFWRRWHMSLSRWFRDYLYIPLGGNRGSTVATYRNLAIVFLLVGLWHGAAWRFVAWGALHGGMLIIERAVGIGRRERAPGERDLFGQARTVGFVVLAWIPFRADGLADAAGYAAALVRPGVMLPPSLALALDPLALIALAIGILSLFLPASWVTGVQLQTGRARGLRAARAGMLVIVLPAAVAVMIAVGFSPFLYFQF
jgi:alginate O-acetyltransferase complex protein AlgI